FAATAVHRLPDPIWSHLARHFRPHARTAAHLLAEMALSGGAVVCIPRRTGRAVHLSTTACPIAPGCWGVQSSTTSPAPACRRKLPATTCPTVPGGCGNPVVRSSSPDRRQSQGDLPVSPPVQPYVCSCGFAFDRTTGNF